MLDESESQRHYTGKYTLIWEMYYAVLRVQSNVLPYMHFHITHLWKKVIKVFKKITDERLYSVCRNTTVIWLYFPGTSFAITKKCVILWHHRHDDLNLEDGYM